MRQLRNPWNCIQFLTCFFTYRFSITSISLQSVLVPSDILHWLLPISIPPTFKCCSSFVVARRWYFPGFALRRLSINHFSKTLDSCSSSFSTVSKCDDLRNLVPFVQFWKIENTYGVVLLLVTLLHRCFHVF